MLNEETNILNLTQPTETISERMVRDHGHKFCEALNSDTMGNNTRAQIYFLKAVSMCNTYSEASVLLNKEKIITLTGRPWTSKRVSNRASTLRKKGVKVTYLKKQGHAGDPVNYDLLKKFSEQL
jgi:hypothetical protein